MTPAILFLHRLLPFILSAGYIWLFFRLRKNRKQPEPLDVAVAQGVRVLLLMMYLTGLIMSMNLKMPVANSHHMLSLAPVVVFFIFQFLPQLLKRQISARTLGIMFLTLLVSVVLISISGHF